jgi:tRNA(Ile)-lysidine synthase TilS/MesJ
MERSIMRGEGEAAEECRDRRKQFVNKLAEELKFVIDAGEADDEINHTAANYFLIAMLNWASLWFNPDGEMTKKDFLNVVSRFFIKGFFKKE